MVQTSSKPMEGLSNNLYWITQNPKKSGFLEIKKKWVKSFMKSRLKLDFWDHEHTEQMHRGTPYVSNFFVRLEKKKQHKDVVLVYIRVGLWRNSTGKAIGIFGRRLLFCICLCSFSACCSSNFFWYTFCRIIAEDIHIQRKKTA